MKELSAEYSKILERKKRNYSEYKKLKRELKDWQVADAIVQMILDDEKRDREVEEKQTDIHNR